MKSEDVLSNIMGGCFGLFIIGGIIMKCSESDKLTYSSTPNSVYQSIDDDEEDKTPEWEEYWYDDPFCHGSGQCVNCNGDGGYDINGSHYMCQLCHGTGRCVNCGGQAQLKGVRQVK